MTLAKRLAYLIEAPYYEGWYDVRRVKRATGDPNPVHYETQRTESLTKPILELHDMTSTKVAEMRFENGHAAELNFLFYATKKERAAVMAAQKKIDKKDSH